MSSEAVRKRISLVSIVGYNSILKPYAMAAMRTLEHAKL